MLGNEYLYVFNVLRNVIFLLDDTGDIVDHIDMMKKQVDS